MKMTSLFVVIFCSGLQLLKANTSIGQSLEETTIRLEFKNESLKKVFKKIENKTDFRFAYNNRQIEGYDPVNLSPGSYSVKKVIETALTGTRLGFRLVKNNIVIFETEDTSGSLNEEAVSVMVDGAIKGKVVDEKGDPLGGASILLVGTDKGVSADMNGTFIITGIKPGRYNVQVSAIGFQNAERTVTVGDGQTVAIDFELKETSSSLSEVVVTGYSRQSKRDVTGAVSTISSDVIAKTPVADVTSVLQGRVAGVTINEQGGPGNEQVVRIRGIGTFGDNDPLYVIDGIQTKGGLNLVNPNDIETITVLKDAANTALYGARGSNGVIVITTKRGKSGSPRLEYNGYAGTEVMIKFPKMMTPQQYTDALWQSYKNAGQTPTSSLYGNGSAPVLPDYVVEQTGGATNLGVAEGDPRADASRYSLNDYRILRTNKQGTNWWKEVFKPAFTQSHQLTLSGATDKSNYVLGFNYLDNKGTLLHSYFRRYSLRVNTEFKIKPWLRVGENMQFAYSQNNSVSGHTDQNVVAGIYGMSSLMPVYDIAGNLAGTKGASELGGGNPVTSRVQSQSGKGYSARLLASAYGEIEPVKGLVFQNKINIDYSPYQSHSYLVPYPQEAYSNQFDQFYESSGYGIEWRNTMKLSYDIKFAGDHKLNAFVAYEASEYNSRIVGGGGDSLLYNTFGYQIYGTGRRNLSSIAQYGGVGKNSLISQIASINYAYSDKYLLGLVVRRDGTSRFTPEKRYGVFYSYSAGWRISSEKFMQDITWINDLKLRAAVGQSGNDNVEADRVYYLYYTNPNYTYYDLAGANNAANIGAALSQIGNPLLHWEVNKTTNIGFDAALFNNRLTIGFSWYNRLTDDLLYTPVVTGLQGDAIAPVQNIMKFTNKGIEIELGYRGPDKGLIKYDVNFNLGTYKNNVKYIDGDPKSFLLGGLYARQTNLTRSEVGRPVSSFYGYEYEGIFQDTADILNHATQAGYTTATGVGHFKFKDLNKDGVINDEDRTYIGSPHPTFNFGLNVNLYYGNFDLGIFFQGVVGNKIFNYWRTASEWPGFLGEGSLDTWTPDNRDAKLPIYDRRSLGDDRPSSFFVEDGSYVRLKNLQLGYNFLNIKGISKLRVYVQGYNLLTFTRYSGLDPEVSNGSPRDIGIDFGGFYPVSRKFIFGVNLGL
ncbi:MAG: TonB-dependent receptor [Chitinophagaceae bacterium]|nr:TonB-dependent receptor [Chitinophagaceae bacterium]